MRKSKKLLKASKVISNTYNGEKPIEFKIISVMCLLWIIKKGFECARVVETNLEYALNIYFYISVFCTSSVILVNMITSLFTGFSYNISKKDKNDFIQLTRHLPISKKDLLKAC